MFRRVGLESTARVMAARTSTSPSSPWVSRYWRTSMEDVVDVDLDLFDQFDLENDVVVDDLLVRDGDLVRQFAYRSRYRLW